MDQKTFDRAAEDLGNAIHLEHVNVSIPDQRIASLFYGAGLGLTRDPYLMVMDDNMWMNVGRSQFHLPSGKAQVLRGKTGIVIEGREDLLKRLATVKPKLADTKFKFTETNDYVEATCPWGNTIRLHEPDAARFGRINLGIPYVEFDVPVATAKGIAKDADGRHAVVGVGSGQDLIFRESDGEAAPYDGHHIAIYVADFSGPHRRLREKGLISEESDQHQYRFQDITDTETGKVLFTVEHEVRSMRHPLYARPLVNRNPAQTNRDYVPGADEWNWSAG